MRELYKNVQLCRIRTTVSSSEDPKETFQVGQWYSDPLVAEGMATQLWIILGHTVNCRPISTQRSQQNPNPNG